MPRKRRSRADEGYINIKARIQKLDKKGQIVICRELREKAQIRVDDFVLLKPLGKGKILLQVLGSKNDFLKVLESSHEIPDKVLFHREDSQSKDNPQ